MSDRWIDCEDCKRANGGYDNGRRCQRHQLELLKLQESSRLGDNVYCGPVQATLHTNRRKSDLQIITERLESIESRLEKMEKVND